MDGADEAFVTRMLAPLGDASGAGTDPRADLSPQSRYFLLRDAQANARSAERQAETDPELLAQGAGLWNGVVSMAGEILEHRAKDLEVAAWLLEGMTRRDGLGGFAAGARIVVGLLDTYWGRGLHPAAAEGEPWDPLAVITGLSGADRPGSLIPALHRVALFESAEGAPVTLWSYDYARELSTLDPEKVRRTRMADLVPPFASLEIAARGPSRHQLAALLQRAAAAAAAWRALEDAITAIGAPDISTGRVAETLERIRRIAVLYAPEPEPELGSATGVGDAPSEDVAVAGADAGAVAGGDAAGDAGARGGDRRMPDLARASREEMFEVVLRIARQFSEREPSSPFGPTLEEAVRRARLPLTELLREVMPDDQQRLAVLTAFGIRDRF